MQQHGLRRPRTANAAIRSPIYRKVSRDSRDHLSSHVPLEPLAAKPNRRKTLLPADAVDDDGGYDAHTPYALPLCAPLKVLEADYMTPPPPSHTHTRQKVRFCW